MSTREISKPIDVGLLGATGMVGQEFVAELESHPVVQLDVAGSQPAVGRAPVRGRDEVAAADPSDRRRWGRWLLTR